MGKPKQFQGELWKQSMEGRVFNTEPGYVTVLMKFPADVAGDVYTHFNQLGVQPTRFVLTLPDLPDEQKFIENAREEQRIERLIARRDTRDVIRQHREKRRNLLPHEVRLIRGSTDD